MTTSGQEVNRSASGGVSPPEPGSADEAFEAFVAERWSKLLGTVVVITQDRALAEDIVQETFAKAYLSWDKLWPEGNPAGWAHRVAVNLAISLKRRAARELRAVTRLGRREPQAVPEPEVHPELAAAVAELPPRQRAAVALHYTLGLPIREVADAMGCRPGTVKSMLHDARAKLRSKIGEQ